MKRNSRNPKAQINEENVPRWAHTEAAPSISDRNYGDDNQLWPMSNHPDVGNESIYFANFSAYKEPTNADGDAATKSWRTQCRNMLKKNAFSVVVLNEADSGIKAMMEGNTAPAAHTRGFKEGAMRPSSTFSYVDRPQGQRAPRRKTEYRPDRSFRCTLGLNGEGSYTHHTNAVCVC